MNKCTACNYNHLVYQQINTIGNSDRCDLLLVGDYPRQEDDVSGYPFTGDQYKFLWSLLNSIGVDYQVTYLLRCMPVNPMSRRIEKPQLENYTTCIQTNFVADILRLRPKCVIAFGQDTLNAIVGSGYIVDKGVSYDNSISDFREVSHRMVVGDHECRFLATYTPGYAVNSDNETMYKRFIDDVVYACRHAVAYKSEGMYKSMTINADQLERIVDIWMNDPTIEYIGFDTESNGLDPLIPGAKITSFSICADKKIGFNIFLYHPELDISDEERQRIINIMKPLLTTKKIVVHHAKHEYRMTKVLWGFTMNITDDTMYMSYILHLAKKDIMHGLKFLSGRFISLPPWEETLHKFTSLFAAIKRVKNISDERIDNWINEYQDIQVTREDILRFWDIIKDPDYYIKHSDIGDEKDPMYWLVPPKQMEEYAGMDAIAPLLLMDKFKPQIDADPGLTEAYIRMIRCADAFANIELHGCRFIDANRWSDRYLEVMQGHLDAIKAMDVVKEYEEETGSEFNPGSAKCMQNILYERLKFPVLATTSTGNPSAGEPAMIALIKKMQEEYGADSHEPRLDFLWHIRDYKKMQKIQNTYFIGLQKLMRPRAYDGVHDRWSDVDVPDRIFTQYMLHGTDSGRASSNYHTIPHRSDVAKAISSVYYGKGGVLFQADHSQLELRVLACVVEKYYGDSALANAYREGKDIHRFNASKVFNKPMEEIVDAERRFSKTISFALCYGASEHSVAESTGRTPEEVHSLFETFYTNFPGVRAFIDSMHEFATQYGCIRTNMGRVRWIDGAQDINNRSVYNRALRQAQNQAIQSAGSDLSLASIAWMNTFSKDNDLVSQVMNWVHDSITIDAAPNEWIYSYYMIKYGMKYLNEKRDWVCAPLGVDVDLSLNWSDHFTISDAYINEDGSWTFIGEGYDYVIEDVITEAQLSYDIIENEILSSKEFTESVGDGLIAKKSFNLSYDNKTFIEQKRKVTLKPRSPKELAWCLEKYKLEQSGSQDMPGDKYAGTTDLF